MELYLVFGWIKSILLKNRKKIRKIRNKRKTEFYIDNIAMFFENQKKWIELNIYFDQGIII